MQSDWPWLAAAGLGALHGLNPATGWMWAAAWGARSPHGARPLRALLPIALGHAVSMALVAAAVVLGLQLDRAVLQGLAAALLLAMLLQHRLAGTQAHRRSPARAPRTATALVIWSFMMATGHGAGLMLVPALMPLCLDVAGAQTVGSREAFEQALLAVLVHTAAMLAVTGGVALVACRGFHALRRRCVRYAWRRSVHSATPISPTPSI